MGGFPAETTRVCTEIECNCGPPVHCRPIDVLSLVMESYYAACYYGQSLTPKEREKLTELFGRDLFGKSTSYHLVLFPS